MRQIESSDPELVRLVDMIDATGRRPELRFVMPCQCPVGAAHQLPDGWLLIMSGLQEVWESVEAEYPVKYRRRRAFRVPDIGPLRYIEARCDDQAIPVDGDQARELMQDVARKRLKRGAVVPVPALPVW